MKILCGLFGLLILSFSAVRGAEEPALTVRLEFWSGCLCEGPTHARSYEQLDLERPKRMQFGADVTLTTEDKKLSASDLRRRFLGDQKFEGVFRFYDQGVIYRRDSDGHSTVSYRGRLSKFRLADAKSGDLIVFYSEGY
jgi:hypothetical protein